MLNQHALRKEVNDIEKLINAITIELPPPPASGAQTAKHTRLLAEMEAALDQLRWARGVRLLLLNAYEDKLRRHLDGPTADDQRAA